MACTDVDGDSRPAGCCDVTTKMTGPCSSFEEAEEYVHVSGSAVDVAVRGADDDVSG